MLLTIFLLVGFLWGAPYFKFCEPYGNPHNPKGTYYLSLQWYFIKLNWYTYLGDWNIDASATFPLGFNGKKREYIIIITQKSVRTSIIDTN